MNPASMAITRGGHNENNSTLPMALVKKLTSEKNCTHRKPRYARRAHP